jgi:DNA replicative helicase MCM subunit Mcm2 (Cdc46/Mcm family)
MSNARVALAKIANRITNTHNTNEGWVVKKMRSKYVNRIIAILPIIYQKDKVKYFNNKSAMMISRADHGKSIN